MIKISIYQLILIFRLFGKFLPSGSGMLFCALHLARQLSTGPQAKPPGLTLSFSVKFNAAVQKNELPSPVLYVSALFFSHHTDE